MGVQRNAAPLPNPPFPPLKFSLAGRSVLEGYTPQRDQTVQSRLMMASRGVMSYKEGGTTTTASEEALVLWLLLPRFLVSPG